MRKLTLLLLILTITSLFVIGCSGSSSVEDGDLDGDVDVSDGDVDGDDVEDSEAEEGDVEDGDAEDADTEDGDTEDVEAEDDAEDVVETFNVPLNGGTFETDSGLEIEIPSGALEQATEIKITETHGTDTGENESISTVYKFEPEGLAFTTPVTVTIPYSESAASGKTLSFYWTKAGDSSTFEVLGGATFTSGMGKAKVSHFSYGFIGYSNTLKSLTFDGGESWNLTYADDTSETAGFQTDIALSTINISEGTAVTLTVGTTDLDPVNVGSDGKVVFSDVTILPGSTNLKAKVVVNGSTIERSASVTLAGCRLSFTDPIALQQLTDAGGDCSTTCGDDLDCNSPNLQYNIQLTVDNIGAGINASLTVNDGTAITSQIADGIVSFNGVDLPHGDDLTLAVSATNADNEQCEVSIDVDVALSCSCHLVFVEAPTDYNMLSTDADLTTEGFQREFTVASDNCLDGSTVAFDLDSTLTNATLDNGEATVMLTLGEGSHTLDVNITETGSNRTGSLTEAATFKVDRIAPTIATVAPADGTILTVLDDKNQSLAGIQVNINGTTTGVETLNPPLEIALKINGTAYSGGNALVQNNTFVFTGVTFEAPGRLDPPNQYVLHLTVSDEVGNIGVKEFTLNVYYSDPDITITHIGGKEIGVDENPTLGMIVLNASDDSDTNTAKLQTTVTATTALVNDGTTAYLTINGLAAVQGTVNSGSVTWNVNLAYGNQVMSAKVAIVSGDDVQSDSVTAFADAGIPVVTITSPEADGYEKTSVIDVVVSASDAETGQKVTLKVNNILHNNTGTPVEVALNSNGIATFTGVNLYNYSAKVEAFTLQAFVTDKAGNAGESSSISVNIDDTVPTVGVTVPEAELGDIDHNDNIQAVATISDDDIIDGATVTFNLYKQSNLTSIIDHGEATISGTQASHTFASIADGSYRVVAVYTDLAGNEGSDYYDFVVDTGCYTFEISSPTPGEYLDSQTVDVIVSNIIDGVVPIPDNGPDVYLYVNGTALETPGKFVSGTYTFTAVALTEGPNTLEAKAFKAATSSNCTTGITNVTVDTAVPTLTLTTPAVADPIWFNATYQDLNLDSADSFETIFVFAVTEVEVGQTATITAKVKDGAVVDTRTANVAANSTVTFSLVTLQNATVTEGTELEISATVTDKAGNQGTSVTYNAIVDRSVPTFDQITPASGSTLNKNDDASTATGFQLEMDVVIANGSDQSNLYVEMIDPTTTSTNLGPFVVTYNSVNGKYEATVINGAIVMDEGSYSFNLTYTDDAGNEATTTVNYLIDYFAELELRDKDYTLIEGSSLNWGASYDEDTNADGFLVGFQVASRGLENGARVWLCSDVGPEDGYTNPDCSGLTCSEASYSVVACQTIVVDPNSEEQAGVAYFTDSAHWAHLKNSSTHTIYAEGLDGAGNDPKSGSAFITVDSVAPAAPDSLVITTNDVTNDNLVTAPTILLALQDIIYDSNKISGDNMIVDIKVGLGTEDAVSANLYVYPSSNPNPVSNQAFSNGFATFTGVSLPYNSNGKIVRATLVDASDNESVGKDLSVIVDIYPPTPSFVDAGEPAVASKTIYQSNCNSVSGGQCFYDVNVKVAKEAIELESTMNNTSVTLEYPDTKYLASQTITTFTGSSMTVPFANFPLNQGTTTVTVKAADPRGNELQSGSYVTFDYVVDTEVPTITYTVPGTSVSYVGTDDSDACGGSLTDQYLTICNWQFEVAGINTNNVKLDLYVKGPSDTVFSKASLPTDYTETLTADGTWSLSRVDFTEVGVYTFKVVMLEGTSGNVGESDPITVTISDFSPTYTLDYQTLAGTSFTTGKIFTETDDKDAVDSTVTVDFQVSTEGSIPDGETAVLSVNSGAGINSTITSGVATFSDVVLTEGEENTLDVSVTGYTNKSITVIADTKDPVIVFTSPTFKAIYNASDDSDGANNGISIGSVVVQVDDLIDDTKTIKLVAEDGTKVQSTLATATWQASADPLYQYKATFNSVKLPNGASVSLDVLDNSGSGVLDKAGHTGSVSNAPTMMVDDDPPGAVSGLGVCIGGSTGSADAAFQVEPAVCGTETYGCNSDYARCNRRNGVLTAYWNAATANATAGTGTASTYTIHVVEQANIQPDDGTCTAGNDCPCDGVDWSSAFTAATLATPVTNVVENATASGLNVDLNTSYCVMVKSEDAAGNVSTSVTSTGREMKIIKTVLKTDLTNLQDTLDRDIEAGDINNDGYADFIIADHWGGGANYNGQLNVFYGNSDIASHTYYSFVGTDGECIGSGLGIGDVNGDGYDDVVAGAHCYGYWNGQWAYVDNIYIYDGSAHIMLGSAATSLSKDYTFYPAVNSLGQVGFDVDLLNWDAPAQETNSYEDIFIGTYQDSSNESPIYMMNGRVNASWDTLSGTIETDRDFVITRESGSTETYSLFGQSLGHGDFNNDGLDDLIVADAAHADAGSSPERFWIVWGNGSYTGTLVADNTDSAFTKVETPDDTQTGWGNYVYGVGDTNNDGIDEAVVMMEASKELFYLPDVTDNTNYAVWASNGYHRYPNSAGDFNKDGFNDIVYGDKQQAGDQHGFVRIIYGGQDTNNGNAPVVGTANGVIQDLEFSVTDVFRAKGIGDFDGDGFDDIAVLDKAATTVFLLH